MNTLHVKTSDLKELVEKAEADGSTFINISDAGLSKNGLFCFGNSYQNKGGGFFLQYLPAKIIVALGAWRSDFNLTADSDCLIKEKLKKE